MRPPLVHAVTDDAALTRPDFPERARAVMRALGPRGAVHLRSRIAPARWLYDLARALVPAQDESGCWLVVNDRLDVALAAGCRAVQLTSRSLHPADARSAATRAGSPALAIGASVHAAAEAAAAERGGADWLVAGNVFETASHAGEPGRGLDFLRALQAAAALPLVAIGGIRPSHVGALRAAGVRGVAAIRGIWGADDAERAAAEYLSAWGPDTRSG